MVTHCFKEVVTAFRKLLYEEKNCELPFPKIGKLQVKNKRVTMKFYQEFMERQNENLKNFTADEIKKHKVMSYDPSWDADHYEKLGRPGSATSVINRPASSLSHYRPGTGYEGVLPNPDDTVICRPISRMSVRSLPDYISRPDSRMADQPRPDSRVSNKSRPGSRTSIQSEKIVRPESRLSNQSYSLAKPAVSKMSDRPTELNKLLSSSDPFTSEHLGTSSVCLTTCVMKRGNSIAKSLPPVAVDPNVRPNSKLNASRPCTKKDDVRDIPTLESGNIDDQTLCCVCILRKNRWNKVDISKEYTTMNNKDGFMKGDNPFNGALDKMSETLKKRKNELKEISNYNYVTAKALLDAIKNEKNKNRCDRKIEDCVLSKRPSSICMRSEKNTNLKNSLLIQIKCKKIKQENDKMANLNSEKLMEEKLLKSLHDERIKNIEAKNRSKENYLILLDKHMQDKKRISQEMKKKDEELSAYKTIFGNNELPCDDNLNKRYDIANYQMNQKIARDLAYKEQKEKDRDFERSLLNQIKEEDETLRKKWLQKKLNQKKFLVDDLDKLLMASDCERRKNEIPGFYPMVFPLRVVAKRCRICKHKIGGIPTERISDLC